MTNDGAKRRERLRVFMAKNNLKAGPWAKAAGLSENVLYNFLNGHNDTLSLETYSKLAAAANVPPWQIDSSIVTIPAGGSLTAVVGSVSDDWKEDFREPADQWQLLTVPLPIQYAETGFALRIVDRSMESVFPFNSLIFCIDLNDTARQPRNGDRVIAQRTNADGLIQTFCRELRFLGKQQWLWPVSEDAAHQEPLLINDADIQIVFLVISSYQPEPLI